MTQEQIQDALLALVERCRTRKQKRVLTAEMVMVAGYLVGFDCKNSEELADALQFLCGILLRETAAAFKHNPFVDNQETTIQ